MRRYIKAVIIFTLIWTAGLVLFVLISEAGANSNDLDKNDVLKLNEIAKTAEEDPALLESLQIEGDFAVLDNTGNLIYSNREKAEVSLETKSATLDANVPDDAIIAAVKETLALGRVPDGAFVKVTLTGSFDAEDEKNVGFIEESFRDRYGVFRIKDESSLHVDYRRYEGDVSLKGEFIRLVESSDLSAERKAAVIRTGLQALRGEGVQA